MRCQKTIKLIILVFVVFLGLTLNSASHGQSATQIDRSLQKAQSETNPDTVALVGPFGHKVVIPDIKLNQISGKSSPNLRLRSIRNRLALNQSQMNLTGKKLRRNRLALNQSQLNLAGKKLRRNRLYLLNSPRLKNLVNLGPGHFSSIFLIGSQFHLTKKIC